MCWGEQGGDPQTPSAPYLPPWPLSDLNFSRSLCTTLSSPDSRSSEFGRGGVPTRGRLYPAASWPAFPEDTRRNLLPPFLPPYLHQDPRAPLFWALLGSLAFLQKSQGWGGVVPGEKLEKLGSLCP